MDRKIGQLPTQNLVSQVDISSRWRQANFWKPIILDIVTIGSAFGTGYVFSRYLGNTLSILWLFIALGVYAAISALHVFFTKVPGHRLIVLVLEALALLGSFYRSDIRFLAAAAVIFVACCIWGFLAGMRQIDNGLDVQFFRTAMPFFKKFTTAIVLTFVLLYIAQWGQGSALVSQGSFQALFNWATGFAVNFYPEVKLNSSISALTNSIARVQLNTSSDFKNLPATNQDALVAQTAEKISSALSDSVGRQVSPDELTGNVAYDYLTGKIQSLKDQSKSWFLVLWALTVFLAIRGFGLVFYWLAALLSFIFYQILLASGFVHVIGESRTHEVIVY